MTPATRDCIGAILVMTLGPESAARSGFEVALAVGMSSHPNIKINKIGISVPETIEPKIRDKIADRSLREGAHDIRNP